MPKLWATTIETHRQEVRTAVMHATAALVVDHGLSGVSMSAIANKAGIGRATLYKYFPDVDSILSTLHEVQVKEHVARLREISQAPGEAKDRLKRVLLTYAEIKHQASRHGQSPELVAALHSSPGLQLQHDELRGLFEDLIERGVAEGDMRGDVTPAELATFVLSAVGAAALVQSRASAGRLVQVTIDALTSEPVRKSSTEVKSET